MPLPVPTIIESPFAGRGAEGTAYLHRAIRDSLARGEAPFASHGFYPSVLNDLDPKDRDLGIRCGYAWLRLAFRQVFYTDLGWSSGMIAALQFVFENDADVEIYCRALDSTSPTLPSFFSVSHFMPEAVYEEFCEYSIKEPEEENPRD